MLASLALAVAASPQQLVVVAARRRPPRSPRRQALAIQSQINFTRENEYEADRIGFQRLEAGGLRRLRDGDAHGADAEVDELLRRQRAVVPAHPPGYARADRRSAVARLRQAVPAGSRFARLPAGARAAAQLPGRAEGNGCVLPQLARRAQVQQRGRGAVRSRRLAVAQRGISRGQRRSSRSSRSSRRRIR